MDFPEIRHRVGLFLGQKDRVACSLVCKAWCDIFTPLLYDTVDLWTARIRDGVKWGANFPSLANLHDNSHHIRQLSVREWEFSLYVYGEWDFQDWDWDDESEYIVNSPGCYPLDYSWLQDFLMKNASIKRLRLQSLKDHEIFSTLMGGFLELKELRLKEMKFDTSDIAFVLMNCKNLTALQVVDCKQINSHNGWPIDMPRLFPNIKTLDFIQTDGPNLGFLLELVVRCPALTLLRLEEPTIPPEHTNPGETITEYGDFITVPKKSSKPNRLEIRALRMVDGELENILDSRSELTQITLCGARLNEKVYKAIKRHLPTLEELYFYGAIGTKG